MDALVPVQVMVPSHRLAEFYEFVADFLRSEGEALIPEMANSSSGASSRRWAQGPLSPWTDERVRMWTVDGSDEERAQAIRRLTRELSPKANEFLHFLLSRDTYEAPAQAIVQHLGLASSHALAGTLSSFGKVTKRLGRCQPFEWRVESDGSSTYYLDPRIAEAFKATIGSENDG